MSDYYTYPIDHIRQLRSLAELRKMAAPDGFWAANVEELQAAYNGIGPDRWSNRFRGWITRLLDVLEAPALIHDWEYVHNKKDYWNFTQANLRLGWNTVKDHRFRLALPAALLCQIAGWKGYKEGK